jgi:hypothetical protein
VLVASLVAATFLWEEEPKMERSFLSTGGTNQMRARQPPPHETSPPLVTLSSATMTRPDTPVQLPRAASPEQPRDGGGSSSATAGTCPGACCKFCCPSSQLARLNAARSVLTARPGDLPGYTGW